MALPSVAPVTLQQIYTEFGAPLGTNLTALVRGGAFVPDHPQTASIPTVPPIGMLSFLGTSKIGADLLNVTESAGTISPADASINVQFLSNGNCTRSINAGAPTTLYVWLKFGVGADFQFFASGLTGDAPTGSAFGVWLAPGVSFTLTNTNNFVSTRSCTFTLQVRRTSDSVIVDSCTISLSAVVDV